jgi:phage host-nuclease inhibitor protein Gam
MDTTTETTPEQVEDHDHQFAIEEVQRETAALDVGNFAHSEAERDLHRYLRRRGQLEAEKTHIKDQVAAMLRGIESKIAALDWVFGPSAEATVRQLLGDGKAKSVKTPFGTAGFRTVPAGLVVTDESKLPDDAFRTVRQVDKAGIVAKFKETGEVVAGCEIKPAEERFFVK